MIPKFRVWHHELGRLMSVKCMFFQDSKIEEFELNDALMNDYITAYPDEIELMQSTGLKDKNGKEIFEGDIVRTTRFLGRADEIGGFYEYEKDYVGVVKVLEGSWVIDVVHNFVGNLSGASAFFWGNAIKYMLRFQKKNGLEDLKKARKNLDWLIEELEKN